MGGLLRFADIVADNVSPSMIKNVGRLAYGAGQAATGLITGSDELIEAGVKNVGKGGVGLGIGTITKKVFGQDSDCDDSPDLDI